MQKQSHEIKRGLYANMYVLPAGLRKAKASHMHNKIVRNPRQKMISHPIP